MRPISFGLRLSRSVYGGLFYVIIGAHAQHVVAGLVFLIFVRAKMAEVEQADPALFAASRLFWYFVVAVWPVL